MERLDIYDIKPSGMTEYLKNYGWHFSKNMYEFAVSMMKDRNGKQMQPMTKEVFDGMLAKYNFQINTKGYDGLFVYSMAISDFFGNSLTTEVNVLKYVKDYIEDPDGYDSIAFTRFYADTIAKGIPIIWTDVI